MRRSDLYVQSEAAELISDIAGIHTPEDPLYVVAIGAPTNVSSALVAHPEIADRLVVIWLGGHSFWWPDTAEFNFRQDVSATRVLFDSGVALVQIPCMGVASHLITTVPEVEHNVKGQGRIGEYLFDIYRDYQPAEPGISKVIWDIATIGYIRNPSWVQTISVHSPIVTENMTYSFDQRRHLYRYAYALDRDAIFGDFYDLLRRSEEAE
jgi:inosine-uridine nucleoside N-ribohydrolase